MKRLNGTTISGALFLLLWGVLWVYSAHSHLAGRGGNLSYDPLFYPDLLIRIGAALSLLVLAAGLTRPATQTGETVENPQRVLGAIALVAAYMLLLRPLGFLISSALFIALIGYFTGYRRIGVLITLAIGTSVLIWLVFTQGLQAPLPAWPRGFR